MKSQTISLNQEYDETKLILLLIKEELKSHKFFAVLRTIGLDDAYFQSDLSTVILNHVGLVDDSNETIDFYFDLLERFSASLDLNTESAKREALNMYKELLMEVERRELITEQKD
jgi:hypothetical protein